MIFLMPLLRTGMLKFYRKLLRRAPFKGQFRIFAWLFHHRKLGDVIAIAEPIIGDFEVHIQTTNFIDASIFYLGDYEPWLKQHFKRLIKKGDIILDIGANVGFHSLYFAELSGKEGTVLAVEPIVQNFTALQKNITLNKFNNIIAVKKALANHDEEIEIHINVLSENPGGFSLLSKRTKNTKVQCIRGDDLIKQQGISTVNFIKIDVEGFEFEVLKGLTATIQDNRPVIIFEYDRNYQLKGNHRPDAILAFLTGFNYTFECIDGYGRLQKINNFNSITCAEIIASP